MYVFIKILITVVASVMSIVTTLADENSILHEHNDMQDADLYDIREEMSLPQKITTEGYTVYYHTTEMEIIARKFLEDTMKSEKIIFQQMGIKLPPIELEIFKGETTNSNMKITYTGIMRWPVYLKEGSENSLQETEAFINVYWLLPHERVEGAIVNLWPEWDWDYNTRWIHEGLAEYAGYLISRRFDKHTQSEFLCRRKSGLERLQKTGKKNYDLTNEFLTVTSMVKITRGKKVTYKPNLRWFDKLWLMFHKPSMDVEVAGYAVSLAFWLNLVDKYGEELIGKFLTHLMNTTHVTNENACHILTDITGNPVTVRDMRNVNLQDMITKLDSKMIR